MKKWLSPTLMAIKAGSNVQLSKSFNSSEFEDGLGEWILVDTRLVEKLQKLRDHLMCPIKITSGYRSPKKQQELKDKGYETADGISTHEVGSAVDIWTGKHTGEQLERAARMVGFKSVGTGASFIHVDIRNNKEYAWTYKTRKS